MIFAWNHFSLEESMKGTPDSTDHDSENYLPALYMHWVSVLVIYNTLWVFVIFFLFLLFLWSPEALGLGSKCVTLIHLSLKASPSQDPKGSLIKFCILQKWSFQMLFTLPLLFFLVQCWHLPGWWQTGPGGNKTSISRLFWVLCYLVWVFQFFLLISSHDKVTWEKSALINTKAKKKKIVWGWAIGKMVLWKHFVEVSSLKCGSWDVCKT